MALCLMVGAACEKADFEGAAAEVKEHNIKLDLPAVPDFQMPSPNPDGTHPVEEMRLRGNEYLGQTVQVKGHVIWVYDCATAIRTAEMSEKDVQALIDEDPTRCTRPNFYVGSTANASTDKGVWVVENPRPPREDEKKSLPDEELAAMKAAYEAMPAFKVGDEVVVTGSWALRSPRGFRDSDGLLVFESMQNLSSGETGEEAPAE
jgi:hypothetical protein